MYGYNLTEEDRAAYEHDKNQRIDPRTLEPGDACVVRVRSGRGADRIGIEYGAIIGESPGQGQVLIRARSAANGRPITLPLIVGEDTFLLSRAIEAGKTVTITRLRGGGTRKTTSDRPAVASQHLGYVLPARFARKPIKPLPKSK